MGGWGELIGGHFVSVFVSPARPEYDTADRSVCVKVG